MAVAASAASRCPASSRPRCDMAKNRHQQARPSATAGRPSAGPERAIRRKAVGSSRLWRLGARAGDEEEGGDDGDEVVQNTLVDIVNLQMKFQKVKDTVREESAKLTETAEQLKEEIDRTQQESANSTDTAFAEAMEELDRIAMEAEQELKAKSVFQDLERSQDDFAAWEAQMEVERSEGQFFKQLYVDPERSKARAKAANAAVTKEEMQAKAAEVRSQVNRQLRNPVRMLIYAFLATVTSLAAFEDALTDKPAWGRIGLYVAIAAALGVTAVQEAKFLREQLEAEEDGNDGSGR